MSAQSVIRWSSRFSALLFTLALLAFSTGLPAGGAPPSASPAGNLDQWANSSPANWQNGNLNPGNSEYVEGDGNPYRLLVKDLGSDPTVTRTFHINYDFTKAGIYKFDTLASYNISDTPTEDTSIPPSYTWPGGTPSTFPFPDDPYFDADTGPGNSATYDPESELITANAAARNLTAFGATITAISFPTHTGSPTGDSKADLIVSFQSAGDNAAFLWSGHLARSAGWGTGFGASSGGGAPFHMSVQNLGGGGGSNQDRSIQLKFESSISTRANPTSGPPVTTTLHDTATVTSASNQKPTGTVTFTLFGPNNATCAGAPIHTETVAVSNGTAATVTGYTPTLVGTYRWMAAYSGDNKNSPSLGACNAPNESATIAAVPGTPALQLTKTADAASVPAGSQIGFTIRVTNTGTAPANDVRITDTALPAADGADWSVTNTTTASNCSVTGPVGSQSLGCSGDDIQPSEGRSVHIISATSNRSCESFVNSGATAADNANHTATQAGDATITETGCAASLELTKTADAASVSAGSQIGYTIRVTNTGTAPATAVTVTDTALPGGPGVSWTVDAPNTNASGCSVTGAAGSQSLACSGSTIAAGSSIHVHIISPTDGGSCETYDNSGATASDNANHTATQSGTASIVETGCAASLQLTKTADSGSVSAGSQIGYTIRVTNTGTAPANGVSISDSALPSGTGVSWSVDSANTTASGCSVSGAAGSQSLACSGSTIAAGAAIQAHIISATGSNSCGQYNNSGAAAADNANHTATQSGTATITVSGCAALTLTKTADAGTLNTGSQIGYMIRVTNTGDAQANGVSILDLVLPSGTGVNWTVDVTNTTATGCLVTGSAPNQSLQCTGSTIAAGAGIQVHITSPTNNESCKTYDNSGATASDNANHSASQQGTASVTVGSCVLGESFTKDDRESRVLGETLARTGMPLHLNELALLALVLIMCGYTLSLVAKRRSMVLVSYEPKHVRPGRKLAVPTRGRRSARILFKR